MVQLFVFFRETMSAGESAPHCGPIDDLLPLHSVPRDFLEEPGGVKALGNCSLGLFGKYDGNGFFLFL